MWYQDPQQKSAKKGGDLIGGGLSMISTVFDAAEVPAYLVEGAAALRLSFSGPAPSKNSGIGPSPSFRQTLRKRKRKKRIIYVQIFNLSTKT